MILNKRYLTRSEVQYFLLNLLVIYFFPATLALNFGFFSDFVNWVMSVFTMIDYISSGSKDPDSYRVFFSILIIFTPVIIFVLLKKPSTLKVELIRRRKIYFFFLLTFVMPVIVFVSVLGLVLYDKNTSYQPLVITMLLSLGMKSKFYFVLIWGGGVYALSFIVAGYISWLKNMKTILFN